MYNPLFMTMKKSSQQQLKICGRLLLRQAPSIINNMLEDFATRQKFRHEVQLVLIHDRVLQTDDVGVPAPLQS